MSIIMGRKKYKSAIFLSQDFHGTIDKLQTAKHFHKKKYLKLDVVTYILTDLYKRARPCRMMYTTLSIIAVLLYHSAGAIGPPFEVHFPGFLIAQEMMPSGLLGSSSSRSSSSSSSSKPDAVALKVLGRVDAPYECDEVAFTYDNELTVPLPAELRDTFIVVPNSNADSTSTTSTSTTTTSTSTTTANAGDSKAYYRSSSKSMYISYLPPHINRAAHGTWIVGNKPGEDGGIAFWKPNVDTQTPIGPASATTTTTSTNDGGAVDDSTSTSSSASVWQLLVNGKWEAAPTLRAICIRSGLNTISNVGSSNSSSSSINGVSGYYYNVLHANSRVPTVLVPVYTSTSTSSSSSTSSSTTTASIDAAGGISSSSSSSSSHPTSVTQYKYYNNHQRRWIHFDTSAATSFARGMPVQLTTIARGEFAYASKLICDEDGSRGWRLFFRNSDDGASTETIVEIGTEGVLDGVGITAIKGSNFDRQRRIEQDKVINAKRGDFIWVWVRRRNSASTSTSTSGTIGTSTSSSRRAGKFANLDRTGAVDNYLLRCDGVHFSNDKATYTSVFKYYHNHRREIMERSMLSMHTSRFIATTDSSNNGTQNKSIEDRKASFIIDGIEVELIGAVTIGSDAVTWLDQFLASHERFLSHDISSCYMYHAAVTIPESRVYAAEIVCVLLGAKPITMIQYTTKTDTQWKFPLVSELANAIITLDAMQSDEQALTSSESPEKALTSTGINGESSKDATPKLGTSKKLGYKIFTYGVDESLIIYRKAEEFRVDLLRPYHTAQALHIVPYPPSGPDAVVQQAHMEQIHNSYINGCILGYPTRFIESYCNDLPNSLTEGQKRAAVNRAKEEIRALANAGVLTKATSHISLSRTRRVDAEDWEFILQATKQI